MTIDSLISYIDRKIATHGRLIIVGHNLHSVYLYHTNEGFNRLYNEADIILADGSPIALDYRLSGGTSKNCRIGSTDWIPRLREVGSLRSVLVIGAEAGPSTAFGNYLRAKLPGSKITTIDGSHWSEEKSAEVMNLLTKYKPDMVLVGLGMPLQESLALKLIEIAGIRVIATIGGAIDQLSGYQRNSPRWLGSVGLEWAWRLGFQPKRLAYRYLVEPWRLAAIRLRQVVSGSRVK
ncbi:WecB/TagA/CpsF family glycosyltransferase [Brevibacterium sp. 50QC2O2]|uniref:WecB/TagA/CpsF family glycosyltransferase n=1 Tax=Brevibacterium sp. 50QC2O2 TaxID=2968459 RepID=UPI00211CA158|nr:WecB/TagA/CpsF family glycosyltransferase [Brevibacterium sp. 50QC2O2]MCQ9388079.1 WecB/TagA/CpsF family glycosyltransferase [Brevibacterium sp. 50QC2O2]